MSGRFEGNVVWITGGGTGIGRALAEEFAAEGAIVAISGRRAGPLDEVVSAITEAGGQARGVICDVTKVSEVEAAIDEVVAEFSRLDVVVANAGYSVTGSFEELTVTDWKRQFDTNVFGLVSTVQKSIPHLRETRGRIGLVGSVAGMIGLPKNGPYSASKFAVRGIGQTLTAELAVDGISCTTLLPGFVESDIARVDNRGEYHQDWEDRRPAKLIWPADRAARAMIRAMHRRKSEAVITGHGKVAAFFGNHAPRLTQAMMARAGQRVRPKREE